MLKHFSHAKDKVCKSVAQNSEKQHAKLTKPEPEMVGYADYSMILAKTLLKWSDL